MTPNTDLSIELLETSGCPRAAAPAGTRFPATAREAGPLNVTLVPIRYLADGSGRLPDTSTAQLTRYRNALFAYYPVPEVNLTVRNQPMDWDRPVLGDGTGWDQLLGAVLALRDQDNPPANTYYYGVFTPADSIRDFCRRGCVLGIGPVPGASDVALRGALGLGFAGESSAETLLHEIGHTLGRNHAPCGVPGATDPTYPTDSAYLDGRIGVWGFNLVTEQLLDPDTHRDMMGYCSPIWISDYTFGELEERIRTVNGSSPLALVPETPWRMVFDRGDSLTVGDLIELSDRPQGTPIHVRFLDVTGQRVSTETAYAYDYSHVTGRLLLVPRRPDHAEQLEAGGLRVRY